MKILIVEDNRSLAKSLQTFLEMNDCECKITQYRSEAIKLIKESAIWKIDCAIVDISLRGETDGMENTDEDGGIEVADELKQSKIPFVILSDHCSPETPNFNKLTKELKIKTSNIFNKPTLPELLFQRIKEIGSK